LCGVHRILGGTSYVTAKQLILIGSKQQRYIQKIIIIFLNETKKITGQ